TRRKEFTYISVAWRDNFSICPQEPTHKCRRQSTKYTPFRCAIFYDKRRWLYPIRFFLVLTAVLHDAYTFSVPREPHGSLLLQAQQNWRCLKPVVLGWPDQRSPRLPACRDHFQKARR